MKKLLFPILIAILILITAILIFAAVTSKQKTTPVPISTQSIEPYASLSFAPETLDIPTINPDIQTVNIMLDTKGKEVFAVQIELQYDPSVISNIEFIQPTDSLFGAGGSELINNVSNDSGLATYAIVLSPSEAEKVGKGPIATVRFQVISTAKPTALTILPTSSVTNLMDDGSVLLDSTVLPITFVTQ